MGNTTDIKRGYRGYYKEHFCRSLGEFHYAMWLDLVRGLSFRTEPFAITSDDGSRKRIPDFIVSGLEKNSDFVIVEIKDRIKDRDEVLLDYINNFKSSRCELAKSCRVEYLFLVINGRNNDYARDIIKIIGADRYFSLVDEYKAQNEAGVQKGFHGEMNPNFGKKHSVEVRKKLSEKAKKRTGNRNPMFGKTHSLESKIKIGKKWADEEEKYKMMRKGMITHISKMTNEEYNTFIIYAKSRLDGVKCKMPSFMNRAYSISEEKILLWFGTTDNFFSDIKRDFYE